MLSIFLGRFLGRFLGDRRGNVATTFAISVVPLVGAVGLAVDVGRAHVVKTRLEHAVDAASLALGASLASADEDALEARFERFIAANFDTELQGHLTGAQFEIEGNRVTVEAQAELETSFTRIFGADRLDVAALAEVKREVKGLEIALVLDNTGSMRSHDNIEALRQASHGFIDAVYADRAADDEILTAIVPYAATVNPGAEAVGMVDLPGDLAHDPADPFSWKGCVRARGYPHDVLDTSPAQGGRWQPFRWQPAADNVWSEPDQINDDVQACNAQTGPNLGCPTPITPLTGDVGRLRADIDALRAWCRGGTLGNLGMAWGWRALSPGAPFESGRDYDDPRWKKVVILMTDGQNQFWRYNVPGNAFDSDYTAYGRVGEGHIGTTNRWRAGDHSDQRLAESCAAMKDAGIVIYTVTFTSGIGDATRDLFRDCASRPANYHDAPSQDDLRRVFAAIGNELANLHLTQ